MNQTRTVTVDREFPYPPEKIWRALTQPQLMGEWLMKADFKPIVGHKFCFQAEWGSVDCQVLEVEENKSLSYTWGDHDLKTIVSWTLTATSNGTRLRMEQTGFKADQPRYYHGARAGWPRFFENLETLLARID